MDTVVQRFRSALGGFNRRDVLEYIARLSSAHRQEREGLEEELARAREECAGLQARLTDLEDARGAAAEEESRVRESLEESTAALTRLRGELSRTEEQLAAQRAQLTELERAVAQAAPMARSYEALKDRVATVELDAHRKAQATMDEAEAQAAALRAETGRWLEGVLERYDSLRAAMDGMVAAARTAAALESGLLAGDCGALALREQAAGKEQAPAAEAETETPG